MAILSTCIEQLQCRLPRKTCAQTPAMRPMLPGYTCNQPPMRDYRNRHPFLLTKKHSIRRIPSPAESRCRCTVRLTKTNKEVPRHFKAQPATSHARGDLQKVGHNALVKAAIAFLTDDHGYGVPDRFVLVAHPGHGVYLEPSSEHVTMGTSAAVMDLETAHTMGRCRSALRRRRWLQRRAFATRAGSSLPRA